MNWTFLYQTSRVRDYPADNKEFVGKGKMNHTIQVHQQVYFLWFHQYHQRSQRPYSIITGSLVSQTYTYTYTDS